VVATVFDGRERQECRRGASSVKTRRERKESSSISDNYRIKRDITRSQQRIAPKLAVADRPA
jgi:hypothetical protein